MAKEHNALAAASPVSRHLFKELTVAAKAIGPFREEVKKTSIHLVRNSAFLGVHPRKQHLLLTIKAEKPVRSTRISKTEQVSRNRWHLDVKLATTEDIDAELLGWIQQAYEICQ
jgi:hypothetical protein